MPSAGPLMTARYRTESLMASACVIRRPSGAPVLDEVTGEYTPTFTMIYTGPCKVKSSSTVTSDVDAASQLLTVQQYVLSLPIQGSEGVRVDDVCEVTVSPLDAGLVGVRLRVAGLHAQTFATARRLVCEVVSGG